MNRSLDLLRGAAHGKLQVFQNRADLPSLLFRSKLNVGYRTLRQCVADLEATGRLVRIEQPIDPFLEAAEIHRRVYRCGGPAIYFARVKGCRFPMVGNLLGTLERARYIFRDGLRAVRRLMELKIDPLQVLRRPIRYAGVPATLWRSRPRRVLRGPVLARETTIDQLPQLVCWPQDGGAFITLPQVYTEDPERPGWQHSNLGMYRIQMSGGNYEVGREAGLHYQIHRGIGVHHERAARAGAELPVRVFVGGPPAMNLAAVMPLPEGLSELIFAGALGQRRVRLIHGRGDLPIAADSDFCICGRVDPARTKPEGPFGDHLGYYSLVHEMPLLMVERVFHREDAIWPFTVVGRPPQEDTVYGRLIHELTDGIVPALLPGVIAVHAVDAAGVHPLLLAVGSERYTPYAPTTRPQELLTQANAILGQGQLSLAKYLLIVNHRDAPDLDVRNIAAFLAHVLERADWNRDLHFHTETTIDTLDYSGTALNRGSKLVIAAVGPARRTLPREVPPRLRLAEGFRNPAVALPGVLVVEGPSAGLTGVDPDPAMVKFCGNVPADSPLRDFAWIVVVDDSQMATRNLENFLWVTFTRSNPAADVHGMDSFVHQKHWGCRGPLVIDARIKPQHAPPLLEDRQVTERIDQLAAPGGPLHGII
jgi:4-hydroxy-3-polyprenylbenzoate decarboxylase